MMQFELGPPPDILSYKLYRSKSKIDPLSVSNLDALLGYAQMVFLGISNVIIGSVIMVLRKIYDIYKYIV